MALRYIAIKIILYFLIIYNNKINLFPRFCDIILVQIINYDVNQKYILTIFFQLN